MVRVTSATDPPSRLRRSAIRNVELAVIAQRLVEEAVRRAHVHHRESYRRTHDGGTASICLIAARIVWRASGSVIRR